MKADSPVVRSMTGQGHAERQSELGTVTVEVRTVNHRTFKCSTRTGESLAWAESRLEKLARARIRRGSVQLAVHWQRPSGQGLPNIDHAALENYVGQLQRVRAALADEGVIELSALVELPGVLSPPRENWRDDDSLWQLVEQAATAAIENLNEMRACEGNAMKQTLLEETQLIAKRLAAVEALAPRAVDHYRARLQNKVERALKDNQLEVPAVDLLREVQIYADRADVSEEIMRLGSHLEMFRSVLDGNGSPEGRQPDPSGRKLDFITQEMFRETNTIGSKAADAEVSNHVVEIKCGIERMRELVQNLE